MVGASYTRNWLLARNKKGGVSQFPRNINIVPVCCDLLNGPRLKLLRRQLKTDTPNSIFFSISRFAMCGGSDNNSRSCGLQYLTRVLNRVRQGDLHQDNGHAACGPNLSQRASMLHPQTFPFCKRANQNVSQMTVRATCSDKLHS